jgi:5-methyltetrahydrofolate--homocysteine methyltransferase
MRKSADVLDFNFDSDLVEGQTAVGKFIRLCVTEPNVARLPLRIDSSKWPVKGEGLKCIQASASSIPYHLKLVKENS